MKSSDFTSKVSSPMDAQSAYDAFTSRLVASGVGIVGSITGFLMSDGFIRWFSAIAGAAVAIATIYYMGKKDKREHEKHAIWKAKELAQTQFYNKPTKKDDENE